MSVGAEAENTKITTLPGNHQFIQFTCNTCYHFHKKPIILTQIDMFCLKIQKKNRVLDVTVLRSWFQIQIFWVIELRGMISLFSLLPGRHGTIQFRVTESAAVWKWAHSIFSIFNSVQTIFASLLCYNFKSPLSNAILTSFKLNLFCEKN